MNDSVPLHDRLPGDFRFGAATAAYQIEGAASEDGRKPSIWDAFSHTPGRTANGDTGDVACDHYHRLDGDLDIARDLGLDAYRFSIAWPRVVPDGRGQLNGRGLDFYDRLVDGCLARGLAPYPTLYHWDLPLALPGGWTNRDTAHAFAEYAATVARRIGDRAQAMSTFNEPWCSALMGYLYGIFAPGERNLDRALAAVHHQHLAHGLAVQAVRAEHAALPLGIVLNLQSVLPASDDGSDRDAVERHRAFHNGLFTGPLFEGGYPARVVDALGERMPSGFEDDLPTIRQPLDWWGLNWYTPSRVTDDPAPSSRADDVAPDTEVQASAASVPDGGHAPFPGTSPVVPKEVPLTDIGWEIAPGTMTGLLRELYAELTLPPCWITENGACFNTGPDKDGHVADEERRRYLERHLGAVADAIDDGCDIRGYFAWSLMDNFEWAEGYRMRFGIVHVDYETQERTVKQSGKWYAELIDAHRERRRYA